MKYLNSKRNELFTGSKIAYRGMIYWANMTTMEIYAHTADAEIAGVINGSKVANITADYTIVKA